MLLPAGVLAVEEHAAGDGAENPADAVAGLGEVDAGGRVSRVAEHRRVRIGDGFEEGQARGDDADAEQKGPERRDLRRRDEPEAAHRHHQQTGDDAALVAQLGRQPAGRQRHQEIAEVVRELHPGRLGQGQMQFLLEVLVHHVDHAVAEAPEQKQRTDEDEREHHVLAVSEDEHALLLIAHFSSFLSPGCEAGRLTDPARLRQTREQACPSPKLHPLQRELDQ